MLIVLLNEMNKNPSLIVQFTACTVSSQSMVFVVPVAVLAVAVIFYFLTKHYDLDKSIMVFKICASFSQVLMCFSFMQ